LNFSFAGCGIYKFSEASPVPPDVKTIKINFIENHAPYINPQLSPNLTDRLKQKINNQTRLTQTNNENPNWDLSGEIVDYSFTTTGITSANGKSQTSINRLTVSVKMTLTKLISNGTPEQFTVSRQFDFDANLSIQQAEAAKLDEMVRNITDEIFNHIFSNW
jgi:hypothetical protein